MSTFVSRKWQYLPIAMLFFSMLAGLYFFNASVNRWVTKTMVSDLDALVSDVIYQLKKEQQIFLTSNRNEFNHYLHEYPQVSSGKRITLIDAEGNVLGDTSLTESNLQTVENHGDRPEFIQALAGDIGSSIRYSKTLSVDMIYVARTITISDKQYVVRISMPMTVLDAMSMELLFILVGLFTVTATIFLVSSILSQYRITDQVNKEKAQQDERIKNRTVEIELLHRLANLLAACNSIQETQKVVEDIVPRILGKINGSVAMMRASRNQLAIQLDWGKPWPGSRSYGPHECWALRKGKYHLANDEYHCLPCGHMDETGDDQVLCIPLTAHGNTIGMLHLYFGDKSVKVSKTTLRSAFTVAEHLGLSLANLSLQEKLRAQALSDPLTGLYNRRHFEEMLDTSLNTAKSKQSYVSLLMLDLDHFKRFNDNFGHDAGDYVLKEVSSLLMNSVAVDDVACRLGGEELAVIALGRDAEAGTVLALQICKLVSELHLELKGLSLGKVTVSIGVSTFPDSQVDRSNLVKIADVALYKAKDAGRNRVIHYNEVRQLASLKSEPELGSDDSNQSSTVTVLANKNKPISN
ncbi:sensor domain-containing diguanylate cyclase [Shewanella sp. TC10]|uniref:sensor domain-containing diguanylate cyclase n=1 Tax=Shewanella sp. TC10 TaxID=1419739 RepID=UPI00129D9622|nr:sensor domain-containing diguanylate cyclase [Shewanella sp. TC10]